MVAEKQSEGPTRPFLQHGGGSSSIGASASRSIGPNMSCEDSSQAVVKVYIHALGVKEPVALDILVSDIEEREEEMRLAAVTFGVPADRWSCSLIFQKYAKQGLTEIHVKPEQDCMERNYASYFQWDDWLTKLLQQYYKTSKLRIPDKCQGVDLLLALEYFGILYQPDQLVFATFAAYQRVQQWSHYFTHRGSLAEWVVSVISRAPGDVVFRFSSSPDMSEGWMEVEDKRVATLEGDDPPETATQAHAIFSTSMVAAELRKDFALFLSKLLGNVYVDFDVKPVAIKSRAAPSIYEDRAVLIIKTTVKFNPRALQAVSARKPTNQVSPRSPFNDDDRPGAEAAASQAKSPRDVRDFPMQHRTYSKSPSTVADQEDNSNNNFPPGEVSTFKKSDLEELKELVSNLVKSNNINNTSTDVTSSESPKSVSEFDSLSRKLENKRSEMMHSAEHIYEDLAKDVGVVGGSVNGPTQTRRSPSPPQNQSDTKKDRVRSKGSRSESEQEKEEYRALAPMLSADSEDDEGRVPLNVVRAKRSDLHSVTSALTGPFFIDEYGHMRDVFDNNDDDARAQALRHEWIQGGILNRGIHERVDALLRKEEKPEVKEEPPKKEVEETPSEVQTDLLGDSWDWLTGWNMCSAITAESREGAVKSLNNTVSNVLNNGKQIFLQCNDAIQFPQNPKPTGTDVEGKVPVDVMNDISVPEHVQKEASIPSISPPRSPARVKDRMDKVQRHLEQSRQDLTPIASEAENSDRREGNSSLSSKSTATAPNQLQRLPDPHSSTDAVEKPTNEPTESSNQLSATDAVEKKQTKKRLGWGIIKSNGVKAKGGEANKNEKKKGIKALFWKRKSRN